MKPQAVPIGFGIKADLGGSRACFSVDGSISLPHDAVSLPQVSKRFLVQHQAATGGSCGGAGREVVYGRPEPSGGDHEVVVRGQQSRWHP